MSTKRVMCIVGKPAMGKSASLRDLEDQSTVLYLNCEAGKELPFKNGFKQVVITDPYQIFDEIQAAEDGGVIKTVVIDSLTMMMEMYESVHIIGAKDSRAGWQNYAQFFKELMQQYVGPSELSFLFTAHVDSELNQETGENEMSIPVKGALKKIGIMAYFTVIVQAKRMTVKKLKPYMQDNDLLQVTKREEELGYKYVFQTQTTKETIGDCIRGQFEMFSPQETYMDNNAQNLINAVAEYYE